MKQFQHLIPKATIVVLLILAAWTIKNTKQWRNAPGVICWDVISYYAYLPATFIYDDIRLEKKETFETGIFWPEKTPNGNNVIKTTMGLAYLYAPFFAGTHLIAKITGADTTGFSTPYQISLLVASLFYFFLGLIFLHKVLRRFFSEWVCTLTLIAISLGTNLAFYLTFEAAVSHGFIFSMGSIFLWAVIRWHEKSDTFNLLLVGFLAGLLTLIRPTNILVLLFFAFYDVSTFTGFRDKLFMFLRNPILPGTIGLAFILPWIPQFIYWKIVSGSFLFYSYTANETFLWSSPKFLQVLLGFRKGWLIYTPLMLLSLIGITFLRDSLKKFRLATILLFVGFLYLISCWWCWWFGGSFGMRPMIDIYAFLSIPLAAFIAQVVNQKHWLKLSGLALLIALIAHNIFQITQYRRGAIHYAFMTKAAYFNSFGHSRPQGGFYNLLEEPDPEPAKLDIQSILIHQADQPVIIDSSKIYLEVTDSAENPQLSVDNRQAIITSDKAYSGSNSIKLDLDHPYGFRVKIPVDYLKQRILVRVKKLGRTGRIVIQSEKEDEFCVSSPDSYDIAESEWQQQEFLIPTPQLQQSSYINIFCCNPKNDIQYYDDLEIYILK